MSDLDTLYPTQTIDLTGRTVTISPFKFYQLPTVMKKIRPVYGHLAELVSKSKGSMDISLVMEAMEVGGEELMELIATSANVDKAFMETLEMDEGVKLTAAFIEVNLSFFVQKVLPEFKVAMDRMVAATGAKS